MSTIAEFRFPATETMLATTFEQVPDIRFELESSVSQNRPCLWVIGADPETVREAFETDPAVEGYEHLVTAGDRLLYDVRFAGTTPLLSDELLEGTCSLLAVWGVDGWWQARVRVRDRDDLWTIRDRLLEEDITADLRRVTDVTAETTRDTRLTPEQQEALEAALEEGYFEIPRQISMEELAETLDISHQALSERLRRAYETLVNEELRPPGEPPTSNQ
ncbi:helix-turn-helix domain-containing protein [Halostagnicola kamekurae]|uniref:Predicted DNA binding protein, contains HTH domain n=1 Tax=Halostagnicola kamekurae TaxID=619731 RepID=A0A1I6PX66_9EURY|nr:helix-turn-helix domain-containing protein [Halostagnicola kamekurae]SFS44803.1 Predicted DNA binding protein, contains HTH domain [Halostagnicola kamekurae]